MKHSVDEETVKQKMRSTFRYRRNMVEDPERCGDVLAEYPRFKDVKGLVSRAGRYIEYMRCIARCSPGDV
jgi:hypothetical protein